MRISNIAPHSVAALLVAIGLASACAGDLIDPERFRDAGAADTGTCLDVQSALFTPTCATSGCHSAMDRSGSLDLETVGVASRLVGRSAAGGSGLLIDPADPDRSVIYRKLLATPPFGSRMPVGQVLDDETIECVRWWVAAQRSAP